MTKIKEEGIFEITDLFGIGFLMIKDILDNLSNLIQL